MMVPAGDPVDKAIASVRPYLQKGDLIIDGGNSHFIDTERRLKELEEAGILFIGTGVSGGESGALWGPSLMPGGSAAAWPLVKDMFEAIAAKADDGEPCVDWMGPGGAGHYVKMVHNGIEYGDMQLIAESYDLQHRGAGISNRELADIFAEWNRRELRSYLIEITAEILARKMRPPARRCGLHTRRGSPERYGSGLPELLRCRHRHPHPPRAVERRLISALKGEGSLRRKCSAKPPLHRRARASGRGGRKRVYASKITSYTRGSAVSAGLEEDKWNMDLSKMVKVCGRAASPATCL